MPALKLDVTIEQGATFQREFTVQSGSSDLPDFAGYLARAMLRSNSGAVAISFTASISGPRTALVTLSALQTGLLTASSGYNYKYDVEVESPVGVVYRIAQGRASVSEQQTRP